MGGEISVFEEDQLEKDLEFLSKNESLSDLFHNSLADMTSVITKPARLIYDTSWLISNVMNCNQYQYYENTITCDGNIQLYTVLWSKNTPTVSSSSTSSSSSSHSLFSSSHPFYSSNILIVYLHTNGRALCDAIEVLPLCDLLNANLFSFDCKGCGKSSGQYSLSNAFELSQIIQQLVQSNPNLEIIFWGRGMGINSIIEYLNYANCSKNIKFVILDSPFTSLHEIVRHAAASIDTVGLTVPSVFIKFALFMMRKSAKSQLGMDPYLIQPITLVHSITIPCYILSADEDDYIPEQMGKEIAQSWSGKCWYRVFPGRHIGDREPGIVMSTIDKIISYITLPEGLNLQSSIQNNVLEQVSSKLSNEEKTTSLSLNQMTLSDRRDSVVAPIWKSDKSSNYCEICQIEFTLMNRRHHCRNCGSLVCHSCSKNKLILNEINQMNDHHVRVCDICYDGLTCQLNENTNGEDETKG